MWTCPKCKQKFYNTNQSHSCGRYTVADFLQGKSEKAIALLEYFLSEYRKIGDFDLHPVKTRIALLTQMRFCAINRVGKDFIDLHLVLTEPHPSVIGFYKIDNLADRFFVHHLKLYRKADLTADIRRCMRQAYDIGNRKHIRNLKAKAP